MNQCLSCATPLPAGVEFCNTCEAIYRAWVAKGFRDLCRYLEKVSAFEEYEARRGAIRPSEARKMSGDDLSPAAE